MAKTMERTDTYVLGHSEQERRRLDEVGPLLRPATERLFREAGIAPGMRVLDVGCGTGEVTLLAAELVGPSGEVVGIDRAAAVLKTARAKAEARGVANARFVEADLAAFADPVPFDAVVGRFVLMYQSDLVAALIRLRQSVRPGGVLAFLELALYPTASPHRPLFRHAMDWAIAAMERSGAWLDSPARLPTAMVDAGLPAPHVWLEVTEIEGPDRAMVAWLACVIRSLLPALERYGIATAAEVDVDTLLDRLLAEAAAADGVAPGPTLGGIWTRTPPT